MTPASFVNASCFTCVVPPSRVLGVVPFRVLLDFTFDNSVFTPLLYAIQPVLISMTPSSGSKSGGSIIIISLSNITADSIFHCRFGSVLSPAKILAKYSNSFAQLTCMSPRFDISGSVDLFVTDGRFGDLLGSLKNFFFVVIVVF